MSSSNVIGTVVVLRHGDRQGYYQDPTTYTASDTLITPLGSLQEFMSGMDLRKRYLDPSSPHSIQGMSADTPNLNQIKIIADSAEGQVIVDSAYAFSQGMFPANIVASTITLANGTNITAPLNGYIYVPIESIETAQDVDLEGWLDCPAFSKHTSNVYNSTAFQQVASENAPFLDSLKQIVGDRSTSLSNMYNVWDYMNVNYIHNATFRQSVRETQMQQARALANYHEEAVFTGQTPDDIGNIAGRTLLGEILSSLSTFKNNTNTNKDELKMQIIAIAYKPFLSLFNMMNLSNALPGMVDYASTMALELHDNSGSLEVVFNFRNGTPSTLDGTDLISYPLFGSSSNSTPLDTFISKLSPYAVSELSQWCNVCNNTQTRGCDLIYAKNHSSSEGDEYGSIMSTTGRERTSPFLTGIIGVIIGLVIATWFYFGLELYRQRRRAKEEGRKFGWQDVFWNRWRGRRSGVQRREMPPSSDQLPEIRRQPSYGSSIYELTAAPVKVPSGV